jgi:hypothetical protein
MEEMNENVAANTEEVAAPLEIDNVNIEGEAENTETEVTPEQVVKPDVTETQAFAQRLKEQTEKGVEAGFQARIDKEYEKMFGESHNVHSQADYDYAVEVEKERLRNEDFESKGNGYDSETINDFINNNPEILKAKAYMNKADLEKFKNDDNTDFLQYFEKENHRKFDGEKDILPNEVWDISRKFQESLGREGRGLKEAYQTLHENSVLKAAIAEFKKGTETISSNEENAASSTGSLTGTGSNNDKALTEESFNNLSPKEAIRRWKEVRQLFEMK